MMVEILQDLTTVMIGLYAGSLLIEAVILVPYWKRMEPSEFFRLHGTMGPSLFRYFAPLTTITVMLAVIAGIVGNNGQKLAGGLCAVALVIFFVYFKKANASFAAHSLADEKLGVELARWSSWHWLRTIIIIIALAASVLGQDN